ncbi:MAG: Na+/H+ antiporter NhaA [Planctomycetes bacterium]|nr:Na+/H+ antiporter NhaA [Planctomycetota bacterium]
MSRPWIPAAILAVFATIGILWANLDGHGYHDLWHHRFAMPLGLLTVDLDLHGWVNDALMTLFFLGAGVEIKRELVRGELRSPKAAALPVLAALGGMVTPIAIYLFGAMSFEGNRDGWAVPVATDVAFALGVLALAGPRVPVHLKLFLLTLAIADDVGGILIIATVFTHSLSWGALAAGGACIIAIFVMRMLRFDHPLAYVPICALMWYFTLQSGIHATIAGVVAGLLVPGAPMRGVDVIERVDKGLRPIVTFVVFPLFAVANTGVEFHDGVVSGAATSNVFWGIFLGLLLGKCLGITLFTRLAVGLGLGVLPHGVSLRHVPAIGMLGGIGFTVSIFIADLSFADQLQLGQAKLAILIASTLASFAGLALLLRTQTTSEATP